MTVLLGRFYCAVHWKKLETVAYSVSSNDRFIRQIVVQKEIQTIYFHAQNIFLVAYFKYIKQHKILTINVLLTIKIRYFIESY